MVCGCGKIMEVGRLGVLVKFDLSQPYFKRGDEMVCPDCGAKVIGSFGAAYADESRDPDVVATR
jgi:hypothetical protein